MDVLKIPKTKRSWWYEYERLKLHREQRLSFVNATIRTEFPEEFGDAYDIILENFDFVASTKETGKAAEFLERFRAMKPLLYEQDRYWYDYHLIDYYASIGKREKIPSLTAVFLKSPDKNVDITFHVLDTLRFYCYAEETKNLSIAAYQKLKTSTEIAYDSLDELADLVATSIFGEYAPWIDYSVDAVIKRLENLGLNPNREAIEAGLSTLGGASRNWVTNDFSKTKKRFYFNLFLLCTEFMNYLNANYSFEYVTYNLLSWIVRVFYADLSRQREGRFHFTFPEQYLIDHLNNRYFSPFTLERTRGVALTAALTYFTDFLFKKKLITTAEQLENQENLKETRSSIKVMIRSEPWRYSFLKQWNFQEKQLFDQSCFESSFFANTQKVGRNEPCPCGSGRKYKKCCGRPELKNKN